MVLNIISIEFNAQISVTYDKNAYERPSLC